MSDHVWEPRRALVGLLLLLAGIAIGFLLAGLDDDPEGLPPPLQAIADPIPDKVPTARRPVPPPVSPAEDATEEEDDVTPADRAWMREALVEERQRRLEAEIGPDDTGVVVLKKLLEKGADPERLFRDFDTFKRPLTVGGDPPNVVHLTPQNANEKLLELRRDGITATLFLMAAGDYDLQTSFYLEDAAHVTLRGRGIDATILRTSGDLLFAKGIDNLVVEDLTVDGSGRSDGVIDTRGTGSMLLRRVRTFGFDAAAGHSAAIGVSGGTYLAAEDCEFLGGFGRSPLSGAAVSLRERGYVYLEGCRLPELGSFLVAHDRPPLGSIVLMEDCDLPFNQTTGRFDAGVEVRLRRCHFSQVSRTDLAKGTTVDLGGNRVGMLDPASLVSFADALAAIELAGRDVVQARVEESLDSRRRDATYVTATTATSRGETTSRWFLTRDERAERLTRPVQLDPLVA